MWNISFKNISISIKILLYTYLLGIILLIALPLNTAKELNNTTILQLRGDYFFHILLFLPWMFFQAVFRFRQLLWLLIGLFFASTAEGLQYFLPYRAFNINDLLANLLGVMAGFAVLILYHFTTKNRNRR